MRAYAEANFNVIQLSDRTPTRLDPSDSWDFVQRGLGFAKEYGLQVILDTYGPARRPWGGVKGGRYAFGPGTFDNSSVTLPNWPGVQFKKLTPPELEWMTPQLIAQPHVIGVLITDDGVDLASDEVYMSQWLRNNTPLIPYMNQCSDGSEWLPRAGTPWNAPELYQINPLRFDVPDVITQAQGQLMQYDVEYDKSYRFGVQFTPLFNIGDSGTANGVVNIINSASLTSFQAYSAVAYGAAGLIYYCFWTGLWNASSESLRYAMRAVRWMGTQRQM